MDKISKIMKPKEVKKPDIVFDEKSVKVLKIDDYYATDTSDFVLVVPHLIDFDELLLRKELIKSFKYVDDKDFHLTAVCGKIESGETPEQAMFRELEEESGIRLNVNYNNYQKVGEYFPVKGSINKAHIYYLPLYNSDYTKSTIQVDGSYSEKVSSVLRVSMKYLNDLKPADLVTAYCLERIKNLIS